MGTGISVEKFVCYMHIICSISRYVCVILRKRQKQEHTIYETRELYLRLVLIYFFIPEKKNRLLQPEAYTHH